MVFTLVSFVDPKAQSVSSAPRAQSVSSPPRAHLPRNPPEPTSPEPKAFRRPHLPRKKWWQAGKTDEGGKDGNGKDGNVGEEAEAGKDGNVGEVAEVAVYSFFASDGDEAVRLPSNPHPRVLSASSPMALKFPQTHDGYCMSN